MTLTPLPESFHANPHQCWGYNEGGQLGLGDRVNRGSLPLEMGDDLRVVELGTDVTVTAIALGARHTCALTDSDGIKCWGELSKSFRGQQLLVFSFLWSHELSRPKPTSSSTSTEETMLVSMIVGRHSATYDVCDAF